MWLSIILAADTTSNIFSELVNLLKAWVMLTRIQEASSAGHRIAFKTINMLIYLSSDNFICEIFQIADSLVKLFHSLHYNEIQKICRTYISASCFLCTVYLFNISKLDIKTFN